MEQHPGLREEVGGALGTAALAGLIAAIVGGVVWGLIVRWSQYEIGFVAWGIGFLVGTAVVMGARGMRGMPYQVVAVVLALVGIVLGKYLSFVWINELEILSGESWDFFMEARSDVWSLFDLLWVGLAVFTAFRLPAPEAAEPPAPVEATSEPRE